MHDVKQVLSWSIGRYYSWNVGCTDRAEKKLKTTCFD